MIGIEDITDAVVSHSQRLGIFDRVNEHEPKAAPGQGLWCAIWADRINPAKSGLASTTIRAIFTVRLGTNMVQEPQDMIDRNLIGALDLLMGAYSGDFTLDGLIRNVDLLGQEGIPLQAQAGYLQQDQSVFRIFDISLPLLVNDVWEQVP